MIAIVKLNRYMKEAVDTLTEEQFLYSFGEDSQQGKILLAVMRQKRLVDYGHYSYLLMPDVDLNQLPVRHAQKQVNATA